MLALTGSAGLLLVLLPPEPVQAATAPPPVSSIRVTLRTDHRLGITWDVPAVYYSPGVHGVVRITRGYTPAASPNAGYGVSVWNRTAETPQCFPLLTPDVVYTFAVWVNDNGTYSARRSLSVRTLKDTTPAMSFSVQSWRPAIADDGDPEVSLMWERECEDYAGFRIVRNTHRTLTGATTTWVSGNIHAFLDHGIPDLDASTPDQRVYYWIIGRDRAGNWGEHYATAVVVWGTQTVSGHVSGSVKKAVYIACCANWFDGAPQWFDAVLVDPAVDGGAFTLRVPPGRYGVCAETQSGTGGECWVRSNGSYTAGGWDGSLETFPSSEIDLVNASSFSGVQF
jgi:hypothetical protein